MLCHDIIASTLLIITACKVKPFVVDLRSIRGHMLCQHRSLHITARKVKPFVVDLKVINLL